MNGAVMGGTGSPAAAWSSSGRRGASAAESGIAILATGDTPVENGEPLKSKLHVSVNLDGRRVAAVFGDDWIVNDGGETTILINNVKLHDGATGAWVVSQRAAGVIADRDFSADDFTEPPEPSRIIEVYAPRAAVYEALPGLLLGLTVGGRDGARLSGGRRSYGSDQTSAYDFKRLAAEAGAGRRVSLSLETGRRIALGTRMSLTTRVWVRPLREFPWTGSRTR